METIGIKELADFKVYLLTNGYADRTVDGYINHIMKFYRYLSEKSVTKLQEVTPEIITQYHVYLACARPGNKKLSIVTQNQKMIAVMNLFRFLVREKNYLYDPTSHIKVKDPPRRRTRETLSEREMTRLLNAPNPETPLGLRDKAILELYYSCGIRNTESRLLTVKDVDIENRLVRIRHPKGGGDQVVPMGKVASLYLEEYMKQARPKLIRNELEETLFLSQHGRPLDRSMPAKIVQKYAKIAKISRRSDAHTLRHTCGTHLYNHGADVRCIQELLRHKSLTTTQLYIEVKAKDLKKVLERSHPRERGISYATANG